MSLIEKALKQLEIEQRHKTEIHGLLDFSCRVPQGKARKKVNIFFLICLVTMGLSFSVYRGFSGVKKPIFPIPAVKETTSTDMSRNSCVKMPKLERDNIFEQGNDTAILQANRPGKTLPEPTSGNHTEEPERHVATEKDSIRQRTVSAGMPTPVVQATSKQGTYLRGVPVYITSGSTPLKTGSFNKMGLMCLEKGDFEKANYYFKKALEQDPGNEKLLNNVGLSFYLQGKKTEAMKYYYKALKVNPDNAETFGNLGVMYFKYAQYKAAEEMFQKALTINPNHPEILYNYALLLESLQYKKASLFYFEKFLTVAPLRLKALKDKVKIHLNNIAPLS